MTIYGLLSIGIQVHLHYCCGKISNIQFFKTENCCRSLENENACGVTQNCCHFEDVSFKIDETHTLSTFKLPVLKVEILTPVFSSEWRLKSDNPGLMIFWEDGAPPGKVPIYIAQHSLVYYA